MTGAEIRVAACRGAVEWMAGGARLNPRTPRTVLAATVPLWVIVAAGCFSTGTDPVWGLVMFLAVTVLSVGTVFAAAVWFYRTLTLQDAAARLAAARRNLELAVHSAHSVDESPAEPLRSPRP